MNNFCCDAPFRVLIAYYQLLVLASSSFLASSFLLARPSDFSKNQKYPAQSATQITGAWLRCPLAYILVIISLLSFLASFSGIAILGGIFDYPNRHRAKYAPLKQIPMPSSVAALPLIDLSQSAGQFIRETDMPCIPLNVSFIVPLERTGGNDSLNICTFVKDTGLNFV